MALTNQLYHTSIKIGEDAQTQIDFETANEIHFDADNAERVKIDSTGLVVTAGGVITVDTIDETTAAAGVTIDSVLLKDGTGKFTVGATGQTAYTGADEVVVDGTASEMGISLLSSNTAIASLTFGDTDSNVAGQLRFDHSQNHLQAFVAGANPMYWTNTDTFIPNSYGLVVGHTAQVATNFTSEFQVIGDGNNDSSMSIQRYSADATGAFLWISKSRGALGTPGTAVVDNDVIGEIRFTGDDGGDLATSAVAIKAEVDDGTVAANEVGGALVLSTAAGASANDLTEALRIDSSQNTIIPATKRLYLDGGSNTYLVESAGDVIDIVVGGGTTMAVGATGAWMASGHNFTIQSGDKLYIDGGGDTYITESAANTVDLYVGGSQEFRFESDGDFHADGDVYAFSTTTSSDIRLKKNVVQFENALDTVKSLRGVEWDWIREEKGHSAGLIAQEVEEVMPYLVKTGGIAKGEPMKTLNYNGLIGVMIEAIKELAERVN